MNSVSLCISTGKSMEVIFSVVHVPQSAKEFAIAVDHLVCHSQELAPGFKTPRKWIAFDSCNFGFRSGWYLYITVESLQQVAKRYKLSVFELMKICGNVQMLDVSISHLTVSRSIKSRKIMDSAPMKCQIFVCTYSQPNIASDITFEIFAGWDHIRPSGIV